MNSFFCSLCAFALCGLTACSGSHVSVMSEYVTHSTLASTHMNTPDPRGETPLEGERLYIHWDVPQNALAEGRQPQMEVKIRFKNSEVERIRIPLDKASGLYVYELLNEPYQEKKGILTYKVNLTQDEHVLADWNHQIWTERIDADQNAVAERILPITDPTQPQS